MSYLDRVSKYLDEAHRRLKENGKVENLPLVIRNLILVETAQGIIDNGGLEYFFEADFPETPSYQIFVNAYQEVGATEFAEALGRALESFPFSDAHLFREKRMAQLEFWENTDPCPAFKSADDFLCGNEDVWACIFQYVQKNIDSFSV